MAKNIIKVSIPFFIINLVLFKGELMDFPRVGLSKTPNCILFSIVFSSVNR